MGISVFGSLFANNKFEDLNEFKLSKMNEKIKLQLICIIEHIIVLYIEIIAEMCRPSARGPIGSWTDKGYDMKNAM